ncbi:TPA: hypothetical protein DDW35_01690 [Candidatus Sumerlaeota bacterium]|nr:hypothetical protein [Candidatus Sumerlaeota bacterium]
MVAEQTTAAVVAPKPVTASLENTKSAGKTETVQPQSAPATNATLTSLPVKKEVVAAPASAATVVQQQPAGESVSRGELARMMRDADVLYARKDMLGARAIWEKVLAADPTNKAAKTLLEETQPEYNALMQDAARRKDLEAKEKSAMDKMSKPITFSTVDEAGNIKPTPLRQLCNTLAMLTGMDVYPAYGGESMITASFVDKPFQEVLDTVLKPIGLKWTRKGDVITITAELKTRVFNLTQDEVARVQTLIENKTLPQILWGESGQPPLKETVLRMEDKLGQLFVQDSPQNIKKLEEFLSSLQKEPKQEIATRIYKIRKNSGPQTRALVEAVLRTEDNPAITMERKVFLQDENLIVRGTLEDLRRVEKLLSDKNIIEGIENSRLIVQTFVIVPREELEAAPDQAAAFFDNVVEVIEILLYRKDGKTKAKEEGRQMWVERPLKQITIVDYADRITAVSDFINSLPQINQQQKREFIFLKYLQVSEDLEDIQKILGLDSSSSDSGSSSSSGGDVQIFSLRRKGEKSLWGGQVRVRLQKVTPNTSDEDADNCTLIINTPTESGQTVSLEENGASQTVGSSYQIEALKISTSGTSNDGTVRLRMTRDSSATATGTNGTTTGAATATTAAATAATAATAAAAAATTAATPTYTLDQYEKQNALVVSYTDTADLMRVREVVAQLDKPEKQVDIETLFVTVNESRAKQYGASFSLSDRSDPRNLTTGIVDVVNNVAQTGSIPGVAGAASSTASTTAATAINTNAANGSFGSYTKMDMIVKNIFGYYFSADLSMLEAEGVVSMNNGPHICAKHNSEATFELWANAWKYATLTESASTRRTDQTVNMTLTPFIASADSIILDDMEIEVRDPYYDDISGNRGGAVQTLSNDWLSGTTSVGSSTATGVQRNEALQGLFGATGRKRVQTSARVKNGGTIVLGGWTGSYTEDQSTGVPGLRNMPWLGKLLFSRSSHINGRQNLLIFLSAQLID